MIIAYILLAIILLVVVMAMTKPDSFRVERATTVNASPQRIFALLNDFKQFSRWSPWEHLDPAMQRNITGADSGVGAVYAWEGNSKAGAGRMEIVRSEAYSSLQYKLDFLKPFESHSHTDWKLEPSGAGTRVTWTMHGPANFISKVMQVFMSMDKMIGKDFESGLSKIKSLAEGPESASATSV